MNEASEPKAVEPVEETSEAQRERLKRPVGAADYLIEREKCPDIPPEFLHQLMFGGGR